MEEAEHLSEPWFSLISLGLKTVEGRLNEGLYNSIKTGETIHFFNDDFSFKRLITIEVVGKCLYNSFFEYLTNEDLEMCLPGIEDVGKGIQVYRKYYTEQEEKEKGVVALKIRLIKKFT